MYHLKRSTKKRGEDGISPVVGVMLMLVVTIIIAAVVSGYSGSFTSGTSWSTTDKNSTSSNYGKTITGGATVNGSADAYIANDQSGSGGPFRVPTGYGNGVTKWGNDTYHPPEAGWGNYTLTAGTSTFDRPVGYEVSSKSTTGYATSSCSFMMSGDDYWYYSGTTGRTASCDNRRSVSLAAVVYSCGSNLKYCKGDYTCVKTVYDDSLEACGNSDDGCTDDDYANPSIYIAGTCSFGSTTTTSTPSYAYPDLSSHSTDPMQAILGTNWNNLRKGDTVTVRILDTNSGKTISDQDVTVEG